MDTTIPFPNGTEARADGVDAVLSAGERVDALFDAHRQRLFALALRMTCHRADALDLVQETFLRALRHARSLPEADDGAEAWLVRVLVNLAHDRGRRMAVRGVPGELSPGVTAQPSPEPAAVARIQVRQALAGLPARRRAIVVMSEIEGLTSPEIGRLLGLRPATVRWHLARAREALQRLLGATTTSSEEAHDA